MSPIGSEDIDHLASTIYDAIGTHFEIKELPDSPEYETTLVHTTFWMARAVERLAAAYEDRTALLREQHGASNG